MAFALITGGNKGIGKAIAEALAAHKFDILLVARSEDSLHQVASDIAKKYNVSTGYLALDLSSPSAAQQVYNWCVEKKYTITALVNNAGYGLSGSFEKYLPEENTAMMQVDMITPVQLCQLFLPMLRAQPKSYILNIASSAAYQAVPNMSIYAAAKSFVLNFSRGLRHELHGSPVSVTCISPGATDTGFPARARIGPKGLKTAAKVHMTPEAVARIAVKGMLAGRMEIITGAINKLGAFFVWLLPKKIVERTAMKIYEG